jgi:hypothetical protein
MHKLGVKEFQEVSNLMYYYTLISLFFIKLFIVLKLMYMIAYPNSSPLPIGSIQMSIQIENF